MPKQTGEDPNATRWSLIRKLVDPDDVPAWQRFYATYGRMIHGVAVRAGLAHDEADDVVQETVTSMARRFDQFKCDPAAGSFRSWLLQLAHWRIVDHLRKRRRIEQHLGDRDAGRASQDSAGTAATDRVPDPGPGTIGTIWDAEWAKATVEMALSRLKVRVKPRHFQIFYLHVIKEQSAAETALAMRTNVGQVYLVKCRLLPLFKRIVKDIGRGD